MSSVTIDYDKLNTISKNASTAASKMNDYIDDLTKKVSNKYSGITGGATAKTQNSEYYVNQKISQMKAKKLRYATFAAAVSTFSTDAQEIDRDVAKKISASKNQFIAKHDYVKTDWWVDIKNWFIDLKNSCPLFNAIGQLIEDAMVGLKCLWADLKYWYKCGGGKEFVGVVVAFAEAIAAVVIAICALFLTPLTGIVAVCAAIGAVITAVNAIVNVITSIKAKKKKDSGDPAWAKIYGDQDTAQDVLRQTNFGDGTLNRLSYFAATGIDVVETVCDFVAIYDGVKNIKNVFKEIKISAQKGKVSFGTRFKQYLFNSEHYTSTKSEPVKWRDVLQKRGKIRTLREYGVTKALSIDQYNKTLTKAEKFANKATEYAKHGKNIVKYTQKTLDYTLGGDWSIKKTFEDIWSGVSGKFKVTDVIDKLYSLKDKNWESLKSDYNGSRGLKGLAG